MRPASSHLVRTPGGIEGVSRRRWIGRALLVALGLPKTLHFNLRCLPFRQAIRLPVLVSHRVALYDLRGEVIIRGPLRPGLVLIGFGEVGAFDYRRSRAVWQAAGRVVFEGSARLGNGFKLSIADSGTVTFGPDFVLSAESQIVCRDSITFGRGCLVSWDALILDSDFHPIVVDGERAGEPEAPIVFGDRVWIGARVEHPQGSSPRRRRHRGGRLHRLAFGRGAECDPRRQPCERDPQGRALATFLSGTNA